jgi:hypothetical protein
MLRRIKVFMGPKIAQPKALRYEPPVSVATTLNVRDQVAFLKGWVQDMPRDTWHRTEKELKLLMAASPKMHCNDNLSVKHLNNCNVYPAVASYAAVRQGAGRSHECLPGT